MKDQIMPIFPVKAAPPGQVHWSDGSVAGIFGKRIIPQHGAEPGEILDLGHGERVLAVMDGQVKGVVIANVTVEYSHQVQLHHVTSRFFR